jgi:pimeloyl-ACP methyl ester carboxylesterase
MVRVMPALFVHGAPETVQVWQPVTEHLGRSDVELVALPGFGTPLPDGFTPTMDAYASWLGDVVARAGEVDLVAHDWGALLALRVLSGRPGNVRSWVVDSGDLSESFRWHGSARAWQGPGGEALRDWIVGAPDDERAEALVGLGVPRPHAPEVAAAIDSTMGDAMLGLYRSAREIGTLWGPGIDAIAAPGLVIEATRDPFRGPGEVRRLADRLGAALVTLDAGHFWMLEAPEGVARALDAFWSRL